MIQPNLIPNQICQTQFTTKSTETGIYLPIYKIKSAEQNVVNVREAYKSKMSQKVEKVHNFLDPPSPRMFCTF